VSSTLCRRHEPAVRLRRLTPGDAPLLRRYLCREPHVLSGFSLLNLFLWRPFFDLRAGTVRGALCLFYDGRKVPGGDRKAGGMNPAGDGMNPAGGGIDRFMPVPPLGRFDAATLEACNALMAGVNGSDSPVSRIENLAVEDLALFRQLRWRVYEKGPEYILRQPDAALLRGERFKHRRNLYNRFVKSVDARFRDYRPRDRRGVLALYRRWAQGRRAKYDDPVYRHMLEESRRALEHMLASLLGLGAVVKVAEADGQIIAFTAGDAISAEVFCVSFEVTDPRYPGLAQFIASALARTLPYRLINTMDDAGLPNLRKSKLLMKPVATPISYCASPVP